MWTRTSPWLALALLLLPSCAPPEPDPFPRRHEPDTYMAELQRARRIRIAVAEDAAPLGYADRSGNARGFTVALGRMVAAALHVRAEFRSYPSNRLLGVVAVGGADIAFPPSPITEEVVRRYASSDPYLVGHQRLLVRRSSAADAVYDLAGERVCSFVDDTTGVALDEIVPSIAVRRADEMAACRRAFVEGNVVALTAQDFLLAHLAEQLGAKDGPRARVVGDDLNTVGYGATVIRKPGFAQFVTEVFTAAKADGRWEAAYERWMAGPPRDPPDMTVWEAAALWPLDR